MPADPFRDPIHPHAHFEHIGRAALKDLPLGFGGDFIARRALTLHIGGFTNALLEFAAEMPQITLQGHGRRVRQHTNGAILHVSSYLGHEIVIVSIIYSSFIDKMDRTRFMVASTLLYTAVIVLTRVFLAMHLQWFYSVCYVIVQILWLIGLMQFWTFMGDVFDARESKRLFPLISTGGLVGMIVAGLGAKYVVKAIGTENLFVLWAIMLVLSIFLLPTLYVLIAREGDILPKPEASNEAV